MSIVPIVMRASIREAGAVRKVFDLFFFWMTHHGPVSCSEDPVMWFKIDVAPRMLMADFAFPQTLGYRPCGHL